MSSKILFILVSSIVIVCALVLLSLREKEKKITIGIIQTTSHPALDQVRRAFITELQSLSNNEIEFVVQNAEGSISQAQSIAAKFHAQKKIDAILAIATPAVQAIARIEKEKPIFIAAVSEPESLGLSLQNICGTTDRIDTDAQCHLIKELIPDVKRVAILHTPGESNSVAMVKKMKASLDKQGICSTLLGVHMESEIAVAVNAASRKSDLILVPADNLLVSAMPLVASEALKNKTPLVVSDIPSVAKGALAARGADYGDLGKQTAHLAHRVLIQRELPESLGIQDPIHTKTVINHLVLDALKESAR